MKSTRAPTFNLLVTNACLHMSKRYIIYLESSRLVAVAHREVWLGAVEHLLELGIGLQLSLVVIRVVAHLIKKCMSKLSTVKNILEKS